MATIQDNKAYLEDSSRFPKLQLSPLLQPRYQHTHEEYNRIIEYLGQLYQKSQQAIYTIDLTFDEESSNPIANSVVATETQNLNDKISRFKVVFFYSIEAIGSDRQQSSSAESTSDEVFWFENVATFGFVPGGLIVVGGATPYYSNWKNRSDYITAQFEPYTEKLYYCVEEQKLYVWDGTELVSVSGDDIQVDSTLSTTSTNPVENQAITNEINSLRTQIESIEVPTTRDFEIDFSTGNLMLTQAGREDETSFEIDNNGNFNVILS